jgi:membrane protease YdiL (CAAX protease family)
MAPPGNGRPLPTTPVAGASLVYRLAWAFYLALAVGGAVWIGVRERGVAAELFVDPKRWWLDLALGLGVAAALGLLWWLARAVLPAARRVDRLLASVLGPMQPGELLALALLSGFAEELFFRGAVQGSWGPVWATVIFALLHGGPGRDYRVWTGFAALAGAALAALVAWRGNLLAAIVAHSAFNAVGLRRLADLGRGTADEAAAAAVDGGGDA